MQRLLNQYPLSFCERYHGTGGEPVSGTIRSMAAVCVSPQLAPLVAALGATLPSAVATRDAHVLASADVAVIDIDSFADVATAVLNMPTPRPSTADALATTALSTERPALLGEANATEAVERPAVPPRRVVVMVSSVALWRDALVVEDAEAPARLRRGLLQKALAVEQRLNARVDVLAKFVSLGELAERCAGLTADGRHALRARRGRSRTALLESFRRTWCDECRVVRTRSHAKLCADNLLPFVDDGSNRIPTVHVDDAVRGIAAVVQAALGGAVSTSACSRYVPINDEPYRC